VIWALQVLTSSVERVSPRRGSRLLRNAPRGDKQW
jgi:hypothetical protein